MRLPAFRLVWLAPHFAPLRTHHQEWLRGRKLGVFPHFSRQEIEGLYDLLHLLTGWRTLADGRLGDPEKTADYVEFVGEEGENLLLDLRQPLVAILGQLHPDRQPVLSSGLYVADSPFSYVTYVEGAWRRLAEAPDMPLERIVSAGLARCLEVLLEAADPLVAEWAVALALDPQRAASWVSTQASILGRDLAIQRCLHAGLLLRVDGEHLDWRRPLEALKEHSLSDLLLDLELPTLRPILEAALGLGHRRSPLPPPRVPGTLVGRGELLGRLKNVVQATGRCSYTVLVGGPGMGKRSVAAALCSGLPDREPLWLSLGGGIDTAFRRLADALEVPPDGVAGVGEGWASRLRRRLLRRPYLLVLEGEFLEGEEEDLLKWLPSGEGALAVLVLSTKPLSLLEQRREAIQLRIRELDEGQSRQLLASIAGVEAMAEPELGTLLPRLGGCPLFLEAAGRTRQETGKWPTEVGNTLVESWVRRQWESLSEGAKLVLAMVVMLDQPLPLELLRQKWSKKLEKGDVPELLPTVRSAWKNIREAKLESAAQELFDLPFFEMNDDSIEMNLGIREILLPVLGEHRDEAAGALQFLVSVWMKASPGAVGWLPLANQVAEWWIPRLGDPVIFDRFLPKDIFAVFANAAIQGNVASSAVVRTWLTLPHIAGKPLQTQLYTVVLAEALHRESALSNAIEVLQRLVNVVDLDKFVAAMAFSHLAYLEFVVWWGSSTILECPDEVFDHFSKAEDLLERIESARTNQVDVSKAAFFVRVGSVMFIGEMFANFVRSVDDYTPPKTVPTPIRAEFHRLLGLAQLHLVEIPETEPEKPLPPPSELLDQAEKNLKTALSLYPEEDYPEQARQILEGIGRTRRLRLSLPPKLSAPLPPPE